MSKENTVNETTKPMAYDALLGCVIDWISVDDKLPELDRPVLAFFPELSGRGMALEVTMREKGSNADRYGNLAGMEGQGLLAHYDYATHWIYLDDIKMPKQTKSKYKKTEQVRGGTLDYSDNFPTTANPFGFEEGY